MGVCFGWYLYGFLSGVTGLSYADIITVIINFYRLYTAGLLDNVFTVLQNIM